MTNPIAIEMRDIAFRYGKKTVLDHFNLSVESGKIYCLVGSSGSGKTTTLRLMNGLLTPHSGEIFIDGMQFDFSKGETWRRSMGYSIQGSGLFPHMTLEENLTIIARKEKWPKEKIQNRMAELCELMSLPTEKEFLHKKPRQISGGQQQRVGIARALFMKPKIMLMDEPFSALDPITRAELQKEFLNLQAKLHLTIVLVTHDLSEAFSMAHEIVLLNNGKLEQKGRPSQFLLSPNSQYVEDFIHSHSPGNRLKEVFLYSVVNTQVYVSLQLSDGIQLTHLETQESQKFKTIEQVEFFLKDKKQKAHYWVNHENHLESFQEFGKEKNTSRLLSTEHILDGMKAILNFHSDVLPVVNRKKEMIGVFSHEALDAL